ncbi:MAG: GNAT family N-acetyltransferase [Defluviitaleaceae bacterium]|nr:GNAT family N-acetyltransferase [Defluviitaleaceae bacterium]
MSNTWFSIKKHDKYSPNLEAAAAEISALAGEIWREHYPPIIGMAQVEYMLEKYQTPEQILADIKNDTTYFTAKCGTHDDTHDNTHGGTNDNTHHETIAYAACQPKHDHLLISKLYVRKDHRGKGLGRAFVNEALALCREYNSKILATPHATQSALNKIQLIVDKNNHTAIKAYAKMGFANVGCVKIDIGGGFFIEDYVMEKWLCKNS